MDYEKKIRKMEEHLQRYPADYQSTISLLKTKSDAIEHVYHQAKIERLRKVAEARRILNEQEHTQ